MSRDWIETGLRWRYTPRRIHACLRDSETQGVVASRDGQTLGFALMEFRFLERRAHLLLLAVDPAHRRRGIGRSLLAWLEPLARVGGVRRISLEVRAQNAGAQTFYAALGYAPTGRLPRYYDGREAAISMEHHLTPLRARGVH